MTAASRPALQVVGPRRGVFEQIELAEVVARHGGVDGVEPDEPDIATEELSGLDRREVEGLGVPCWGQEAVRGSSQETHGVGDDDQYGCFVDEHADGHRDTAEQDTREQDGDGDQGDPDVLAQVGHGASCEGDGVWQFVEVIAHQSDIGGLHCHRTTRSTHRNPDVGGRERGRVVDAVADHRDDVALSLECDDGVELVLRQ